MLITRGGFVTVCYREYGERIGFTAAPQISERKLGTFPYLMYLFLLAEFSGKGPWETAAHGRWQRALAMFFIEFPLEPLDPRIPAYREAGSNTIVICI